MKESFKGRERENIGTLQGVVMELVNRKWWKTYMYKHIWKDVQR
jgi:hypothetical protein